MEELNDHTIELLTCKTLKSDLCGNLIKLTKDEVKVSFFPTKQMVCDEESNLVHSGFLFNVANYAAMCLVNQSNSLTIGSETEFLAPVESGQEIIFTATIKQGNNKKFKVQVIGSLLDIKIFEANFNIAVFEKALFKLDFKE